MRIERLILVSATKDSFLEAINSMISVDVYQASKTMVENGIFLATAASISSLARSGLLLNE